MSVCLSVCLQGRDQRQLTEICPCIVILTMMMTVLAVSNIVQCLYVAPHGGLRAGCFPACKGVEFIGN